MSGDHDNLRIEPLRLRRAMTHVQVADGDNRLVAVHGEGGCVLEIEGNAMVAWMPLRGRIQVHTAGLNVPVHAKWALVTGPEVSLRATVGAGSKWFALIGSEAAWQRLMANLPAPCNRLLPAMHAADRELRRTIMATARCMVPGAFEGAIDALAETVAMLQAPLYTAIARTPGRSFATRLQGFLRLQHVRRYMNANCEQDIDNDALARVANYSPCHFLRTFKKVYHETPHTYLIRQRLRQAQRLLRSGGLAVTEVALASGFDSRNTFSRCYRQYFGMTARDAMRRNAPGALRSAAG